MPISRTRMNMWMNKNRNDMEWRTVIYGDDLA